MDYFEEAINQFVKMSGNEHTEWRGEKSEQAKGDLYRNFCQKSCALFSDKLPLKSDRILLYQSLLFSQFKEETLSVNPEEKTMDEKESKSAAVYRTLFEIATHYSQCERDTTHLMKNW